MTKFSKVLHALDQTFPEPFAGNHLRYKQLKKLVSPELKEFVSALRDELRRINILFKQVAASVLKAYELQRQQGLFTRLFRGQSFFVTDHIKLPLTPWNVLEQAHWCTAFAEVNATALRKIMKKLDRVTGTDVGKAALHSLCEVACSFLKSPELERLRAVREWYQRQMPQLHKKLVDRTYAQLCTSLPHMSEFPLPCFEERMGVEDSVMKKLADAASNPRMLRKQRRQAQSHISELWAGLNRTERGLYWEVQEVLEAAIGKDREEAHLYCPDCWGILHSPVMLACGHVFCASCLHAHSAGDAAAATGLPAATAVATHCDDDNESDDYFDDGVVDDGWTASGVSCPMGCKCASVWMEPLPELDELARLRDPAAWRQQRSKLRQCVQGRVNDIMHTLHAPPHATSDLSARGAHVGAPAGQDALLRNLSFWRPPACSNGAGSASGAVP